VHVIQKTVVDFVFLSTLSQNMLGCVFDLENREYLFIIICFFSRRYLKKTYLFLTIHLVLHVHNSLHVCRRIATFIFPILSCFLTL